MNTDQIRNILNIVFMIAAAIAVICYFTTDFRTFFLVCLSAIGIKIIEFVLRFMI